MGRAVNQHRRLGCLLALAAFAGLALAAGPALAQESGGDSNPICQDSSDTIANMIEGFLQITTGLGIMGLLIVWQADSLAEMFTMSQKKKANIKRHRISAMKSGAILVMLGPLFTVAGSAMELPIAQCVDLIPF